MDEMPEEKKYTLTWDIDGVTQSLIFENLKEVAYMREHTTGNCIIRFYKNAHLPGHFWDKKPDGWDDLKAAFLLKNKL